MRHLIAPVALLCLASSAVAHARAVPHQGVSMDTRRLVLELALMSEGLEAPLLVGVRGGSSHGLSQRVAHLRPDAPLRFQSLPSEGAVSEQVALAMGRVGARCALSLEPAGERAWTVRYWGECAEPSGVVLGSAGNAGTRVGAAMFGDPRGADAVSEQLGLQVHDGPGPDPDAAWHVAEGSGYPLSTRRFALQVGDLDTVRQLERERRWGTSTTVLLASAGGAAALTGLVVMGQGFTTASKAVRYEQQVAAEQQAWTGVVISAAGALVISGVPRLRRSIEQRYTRPDQLYTLEQAERWAEDYNRELERELGLGALTPTESPETPSIEDTP